MMTTAQCEQCGADFEFEWLGRPRFLCPPCLKLNIRTGAQIRRDRLKLGQDEAVGRSLDGLFRLQVRTEVKCAALLGVTRQRVQQVTRSAVGKLQRSPVLRHLWADWRGQADPDTVLPKPGRRKTEPSLGQELEAWWRLVGILTDEGLLEEAEEVRREIRQCQEVWRRELQKHG